MGHVRVIGNLACHRQSLWAPRPYTESLMPAGRCTGRHGWVRPGHVKCSHSRQPPCRCNHGAPPVGRTESAMNVRGRGRVPLMVRNGLPQGPWGRWPVTAGTKVSGALGLRPGFIYRPGPARPVPLNPARRSPGGVESNRQGCAQGGGHSGFVIPKPTCTSGRCGVLRTPEPVQQ